jgi:hypothetical protein
VLDPAGCVLHGLGCQAAAMNAAIDFAAQQAGGFQYAQVFGDCGKRNVEWFGEFADGGYAMCEAREDSAASGIGESAEGGVEWRIVNHMV